MSKLGQAALNIIDELRFIAAGADAGFVGSAQPRPLDGCPVFTYHDAPRRFAADAAFLADNGYRTLSADEFHAYLAGTATFERPVVITFDDGRETVWSRALPVLERFASRAIAFIVPDWIGRPGYLTWDQARALSDSGRVDIASHSLSHQELLRRTPEDEPRILRQMIEGKREIERRLPGLDVRDFCLPYGHGDAWSADLAGRAGYRSVFWARRDRTLNRPGDDPRGIVRLKNDYLRRLPGDGRRPLASMVMEKMIRRLRGEAYA